MKFSLLIPSLILIVALVIDLKFKKIPDLWIILSVGLALMSNYYFFQFEGLKQGAVASLIALVLTLPLVLIGALGSRDMKLLFAFGLATTYTSVFSVTFFAFFWAAIIGVAIALKKGTGMQLLKNSIKVLSAKANQTSDLQKVPFTIALALGWITYLAFGLKQGAL